MNVKEIWSVPYFEDGVSRVLYHGETNSIVNSGGEGFNVSLSSSYFNKYFEVPMEIADGVNFSDDFWDFTKFKKDYQQISDLRFKFSKVKTPAYKYYLKRFVLTELFHEEHRFSTVKGMFNNLIEFLNFLENKKYITIPKAILDRMVKDYFNSLANSARTKQYKVTSLKKLFTEFEQIEDDFRLSNYPSLFGPKGKTVIKYRQLALQKESGKTPNIPSKLFRTIIDVALRDMEDEKLNLIDRMSAALIVIISQVGMRRGEALLLEVGNLEEIEVFNGTKKAYKLSFWTYKTTSQKDGRFTITFMTNEAVKAYKKLEELADSRRKNGKWLYPNTRGDKYNTASWDRHLFRFFTRNQSCLGFEMLSERDLKKVIKQKINKSHILDKKGYHLSDEDLGEIYYKIKTHQFRVAVCNELRKQDVPLPWIKKHMNHLEEEMTMHYFREDEEVLEETLLNRASTDGYLETNRENISNNEIGKELDEEDMVQAYNAINQFLRESDLKIYRDLDEILEIFSSTPVLSMASDLGFCVNAMETLCERQELLNIKWAYLRPQMLNLSVFHITYNRIVEKLKLVKHMKKVVKEDNLYQREYDLEVTAFHQYCENKFFPEFDMLREKLKKDDNKEVFSQFPHLEFIILNLEKTEKFEMECREWLMNEKFAVSS